MKIKILPIAFLLIALGFLNAQSEGLKLVDERVISLDNPDWWEDIYVPMPKRHSKPGIVQNQVLKSERKINELTANDVSKEEWSKMQLKQYLYLARIYQNASELSAVLYFKVAEKYRALEDYKRARNGYYTALSRLKKIENPNYELKSLMKSCEMSIERMNEQLGQKRQKDVNKQGGSKN